MAASKAMAESSKRPSQDGGVGGVAKRFCVDPRLHVNPNGKLLVISCSRLGTFPKGRKLTTPLIVFFRERTIRRATQSNSN